MKLKLQDVQQRLNVLSLLPMAQLSQSVRIKIVRSQVELDKVNTLFQSNIAEGLKKLKPEGFDERFAKYQAAFQDGASQEDTDAAKAVEGYDEFKAEYDKVNSEYQELIERERTEHEYALDLPQFNDSDLENIAEAIPSGGTTAVIRTNADGTQAPVEVSNDELLRAVISIL